MKKRKFNHLLGEKMRQIGLLFLFAFLLGGFQSVYAQTQVDGNFVTSKDAYRTLLVEESKSAVEANLEISYPADLRKTYYQGVLVQLRQGDNVEAALEHNHDNFLAANSNYEKALEVFLNDAIVFLTIE